MNDAPSLETGTIMAAPHGPSGEDFYQITRVISRGTVEMRQITADANGNPVASAFVAPAFTAAVTVAIAPDRQAGVWGKPSRQENRA